jgi:ATP-dependent Clp protease adaptor protein ClpS
MLTLAAMTPVIAAPRASGGGAGQDGGGDGDGNGGADFGDAGVAVQEGRPKLKEPRKFVVLLHNDDYTTMEFVVEVLTTYFHKTEAQAHQIMLKVHQEGQGAAGVYSFEIAETKAAQVMDAARSRGFPLKCSVEPES